MSIFFFYHIKGIYLIKLEIVSIIIKLTMSILNSLAYKSEMAIFIFFLTIYSNAIRQEMFYVSILFNIKINNYINFIFYIFYNLKIKWFYIWKHILI